MSYDKFGQLSEQPSVEQPEVNYSAWRDDAERREREWREQDALVRKLKDEAGQIQEMLQLTIESYDLAGKTETAEKRAEVGQALKEITENQNILRSLEAAKAAAEEAKVALELEIKKLRSIDDVYDKVVAKKLGELKQKPEALN